MLNSYKLEDVLLVPQYSELNSRLDSDISGRFSRNVYLSVPIASACMDTITQSNMAIAMAKSNGIGIVHRFMSIDEQITEVRRVVSLGFKPVAAAVGIKSDFLDRAKALEAEGVNVVVIDVAHAHTKNTIEALKTLKKELKIDVVVGNIATREAALDLLAAGADGLRVGIGTGSVCETWKVAGCGMSMLKSLSECKNALKFNVSEVPIIADGGIKNSGDIVKVLAAGADSVIVGGLLAGTEEVPGYSEGKFLEYGGAASKEAIKRRVNKTGDNILVSPEGKTVVVPPQYKSAEDVVKNLALGIRAGFSYIGARNLKELQEKAQFTSIY